MADDKSPLNGAYYGPSVPPQKTYHRHGRGRGCGCCCCLLRWFLQVLLALIIIIAIAVAVFWVIVRPQIVKFRVSDATLSEFDFTSNATLGYNLNMNITVRNPNKKLGFYFDTIEARPFYKGQRLDAKFLDSFYLGHKRTSFVNPLFKGQHIVPLSSSAMNEYNDEKASSLFPINVKLYLRVRVKIADVKLGHFKPRVSCNLLLPLNGTAGVANGIGKRCSVRYIRW